MSQMPADSEAPVNFLANLMKRSRVAEVAVSGPDRLRAGEYGRVWSRRVILLLLFVVSAVAAAGLMALATDLLVR